MNLAAMEMSNREGYSDTTAEKAISRLTRQEKKKKRGAGEWKKKKHQK